MDLARKWAIQRIVQDGKALSPPKPQEKPVSRTTISLDDFKDMNNSPSPNTVGVRKFALAVRTFLIRPLTTSEADYRVFLGKERKGLDLRSF